jgi:hypothetical protein
MIVIRVFPDRAARYIVSSRTKRYIEAHVNDSSYSLPKFCVFRNHHPPPPPPHARACARASEGSVLWMEMGRCCYRPIQSMICRRMYLPSSIGHPPHSSASPVELRLRVGPRALSGKKKELR